jgi:hypothetical protein
MTIMIQFNSTNVAVSAFLCLIVTTVLRTRRRSRITKLKGPSSTSVLFGLSRTVLRPTANGSDLIDLIEEWGIQHGSVFRIPTALGMKDRLVLCDPKAVFHHYSNDTITYRQSSSTRDFFETFVSRW